MTIPERSVKHDVGRLTVWLSEAAAACFNLLPVYPAASASMSLLRPAAASRRELSIRALPVAGEI